MKLALLGVALLATAPAQADPLQLVQKFAPRIVQELGSNPVADEFTRVDFDGDWDPNNNWDHLTQFSRPATVYYAVIESERHYFITYGIFYPRDYSRICFWIHCHENDFEGLRITIEKPSRLKTLETLAHNHREIVNDPLGVEVQIEAEGHGIHPQNFKKGLGAHRTYQPSDYQLRSMIELWDRRATNLFVDGHFGGKKWIPFGFYLGTAKPPWRWEVWGSGLRPGEWFLNPLKGTSEHYVSHPYR